MTSSQSDSRTPTGAQAPTRASWSGLLQVSLVAVPVKAYPAVSSGETVRFNQLHAECGERIRQQKQCPVHGPVESAEIVKGYQYAPDESVRVEDSELDALRPPREKALCLEQFPAAGELDPARFAGRTLYLAPDGMAARRGYAVLAAAMHKRGCCGVGRVVLAGRRQPAVVRPQAGVLCLHLLHDPERLRAAGPLAGELPEPAEDELELACRLLDAGGGPVDWSRLRDDTAEKLTQLVEAKLEGRTPQAPDDEQPAQVVRLLDALQQSVAETGSSGQARGQAGGGTSRAKKGAGGNGRRKTGKASRRRSA